MPIAIVISPLSWVLVSGADRLHQGFPHGRLVLLDRPPCMRHVEVVHLPAGLRNHVLAHVCPASRLLVLHLCCVDRGGVRLTATVMAAVFPHIEMDPLLVRLLLGCFACPPPPQSCRDRLVLSFFWCRLRHNIVPLFFLVVAGFLVLVVPHLRQFSESDCASGLLDASVSGILVSPGGPRRCSPVVALLGPSRLAGPTVIAHDPECTERSL